jgi:hypothetical protein
VLVCFGVGMLIGNFGNGAFIDSNAATSELVAAGYELPAASPSVQSTIPSVDLTAVKLYGRALSDAEIGALATDGSQADDTAVEQPTDVASAPVNLEDGLLASGDSLSVLADTTPRAALTFSASVNLPAGDEPISGTLFGVGTGADAMVLGVEDGKLFWRTGGSTIAQRVALPRGKDDDGNPRQVHVAATYDGQAIRLYTDGTLYRRVNWNNVWLITMGISVVLLAVLTGLFRDDVAKTKVAEESEKEDQEKS